MLAMSFEAPGSSLDRLQEFANLLFGQVVLQAKTAEEVEYQSVDCSAGLRAAWRAREDLNPRPPDPKSGALSS